jgi:hypothetical protein
MDLFESLYVPTDSTDIVSEGGLTAEVRSGSSGGGWWPPTTESCAETGCGWPWNIFT